MHSTFVLLLGIASADSFEGLPRPKWKPFGLQRRNDTSPPAYETPSTSSTTTSPSSSSAPTLIVTSSTSLISLPSSSSESSDTSSKTIASVSFTYSPPSSTLTSTLATGFTSSGTTSSETYGGASFTYSPLSSTSTSIFTPGTSSSGTTAPGTAITGPSFSYQPQTSSNASSPVGPSTGTAPTVAVCSGATLNVYSASLDWWFTQTYTFVATTIDVQYDTNDVQTGWTAYPATTTFDISSALAAPSCTVLTTYNSNHSESVAVEVCESTPAPVAASTTVISQSGFKTLNSTTGTGTSIPDVAITAAPASVVIPSSGGSYAAGTPFVFFSRYEIVTKSLTTYRNGSVGCAEATGVYNMSNPFSFEYAGGDVNGSSLVNAGVTGDVAPAFLGVVNVTNAIAGSWVAEPTVAVVLIETVAAQAVLAAHTEASATALITPTPTLPSGISLITTTPTSPGTYTAPSARIESTQKSLDIPTPTPSKGNTGPETSTFSNQGQTFVAHIESTETTLVVPVPTSAEYITTVIDGQTITATAIGDVAPTAGDSNNGGGGVGGLISAIGSAANTSPTNALQVLTQALQTANPEASAIIAGIGGGVTPQGGQDTGTQPVGAAANIPLVTVGSQTFTGNAATQYNIGGSMLTPGGEVVVSGTTINMAAGATAVTVNGQGQNLAPPVITPAPVLSIGGTAYVPNKGSTYNIGPQLLTPGGVITVSGTTVSLQSDASYVVVNGATLAVAASNSPNNDYATITAPAVLTIDGQTVSPNGGTTYVVSGQTLTPGGEIVINGPDGLETLSLNPGADQLVTITNGHATTSFIDGAVGAGPGGAPILTIDGTTYSAASWGAESGATYVIDGQTLTPGGQMTVSGPNGVETISLLPGGTAIVAINGGTTTTSTIPGAYGVNPTAAPILTVGGETFTAINDGATYVINGETLTPGEIETVTISGQVYIVSLSPAATILEIEMVGSNGGVTATSFETLFPATGRATHGGSATGGPSATTSPGASGAGLSSAAHALALGFSGAVIAIGSLALAVWL